MLWEIDEDFCGGQNLGNIMPSQALSYRTLFFMLAAMEVVANIVACNNDGQESEITVEGCIPAVDSILYESCRSAVRSVCLCECWNTVIGDDGNKVCTDQGCVNDICLDYVSRLVCENLTTGDAKRKEIYENYEYGAGEEQKTLDSMVSNYCDSLNSYYRSLENKCSPGFLLTCDAEEYQHRYIDGVGSKKEPVGLPRRDAGSGDRVATDGGTKPETQDGGTK